MKITKRQLKRIIKEEKAKLQEVETLKVGTDEYDTAMAVLFTALRDAFTVALEDGLIIDDIEDAYSEAKDYLDLGSY
jgi:hypothetical protein